MHLQYRHNGGYDSVLLVNDAGVVRSDWTVTRQVMEDFCDCSQDAGEWDDRGGDEHDPAEYGELIAERRGHELTAVESQRWPERVQFFTRGPSGC